MTDEQSSERQPLLIPDLGNALSPSPLLDTNDQKENTEEQASLPIKSFLIACAANLYEYYDFALLGFFATQISQALFPHNQSTGTAIIEIYALYAAGFLARPFGGVVFGYFGDKYGRKSALRMAMILMSFPTFLTGCIPPFEIIGMWAPFILLLLRLVQGLSTGGENSAASIYVYESAPKKKRAFWLSIFGICSSGTLIASVAHVIVQNACSSEQLFTWGWRVPFFAGLGLFVFSLWAKGAMETTVTFTRLENSPYVHRNPIKYVCSHNSGTLMKFVFASSIQHGSAYMIFVFLPSYLENGDLRPSFTNTYAYTINCINSVAYLPLILLVGYLTDITEKGALKFLMISNVAVIFLSPFVFYALSISKSYLTDWLLQFIMVAACVPMWGSIFFWYISELLPDPRTRVTIYGVGYNLGAAVFGGTASLIASSLVESAGSTAGMVLSGSWMSMMALMCLLCVGFIEFVEKPRKARERYYNIRRGGKKQSALYLSGSESDYDEQLIIADYVPVKKKNTGNFVAICDGNEQ